MIPDAVRKYVYYEEPNIILLHGDCLEILPLLEPGSIDLVLTDPPYGLDKRLSSGGGKHKNSKFRLAYAGEKWDKKINEKHFELIFKCSLNQIIFGANYYSMPPTRGIICWDKKQMMPTFSRWEYAWTNYDMPAKMFECRTENDNKHPTQKPLKLMLWCLSWNESTLILDPFGGSCTTAVAAKQLGRKCIVIEQEAKYLDIGIERLRQEILL